jgi:hypothetical protein
MQSGSPSPARSWRAALVVACLAGTTVVCAILATEVRRANAALEAMTSQTLGDYTTSAGRILGTEAIRRSEAFRSRLYGPLMGTIVVDGAAPPLHTFAHRADSLFAAEKYEPDSLRGYLRVDVRNRTWEGLRSMADSSRAAAVVAKALARARLDTARTPLLILPGSREPIIVSAAAVADADGRQYMYIVVQARATNFRHAMQATMQSVPLLPPSFAGSAWNFDKSAAANHVSNDSLIGVRITAVDGTVLYVSPHSYNGPYRGQYHFQSGPDGFTIETVLRPSLATALVPAVVRTTSRSLYIGLGLVACFLLAVSFIAFWGEMSHQTAERARSMQQLTTGLRHELNNALASVMLESQMLAASDDASPDARYAGAAIAEQADRMRKALRRLDNVERLPVVNYIEGKSMVDLTGAKAAEQEPETAHVG